MTHSRIGFAFDHYLYQDENLAWAAESGLGVVVEALNSFENPRYILTSTREKLQRLADVNRPNLSCQYDIYHRRRVLAGYPLIARKH